MPDVVVVVAAVVAAAYNIVAAVGRSIVAVVQDRSSSPLAEDARDNKGFHLPRDFAGHVGLDNTHSLVPEAPFLCRIHYFREAVTQQRRIYQRRLQSSEPPGVAWRSSADYELDYFGIPTGRPPKEALEPALPSPLAPGPEQMPRFPCL